MSCIRAVPAERAWPPIPAIFAFASLSSAMVKARLEQLMSQDTKSRPHSYNLYRKGPALVPAAAPRALRCAAQRFAEGFKQCAVDRVAVRIVFGMPLHAEGKARRIRDADRLDGAVLGHALDHDALARLENALAVQRVDLDLLAAEDGGEGAARHQADLMPIGE